MKPARYREKAPPAVMGPNGFYICRCGCEREVTPPRKVWYSQQCYDTYMIQYSGRHLRKAVQKRDKGVCRNCGLDCLKLRRDLRKFKMAHGIVAMNAQVRALGLYGFKLSKSYWSADHIIPVWEGGGQCDLSNMQTLCNKCHHLKSLAEAKRRSRRTQERRKNLDLVPKKGYAARQRAKFFAKRRRGRR